MCPINDEVVKNSAFLDFDQRSVVQFDSIEYFTQRFPKYFMGIKGDKLFEEFCEYQLLKDDVLPQSMRAREWDTGQMDYCRMDRIWTFLLGMKHPSSEDRKFSELAKLVKLVLALPHSNADEERIFNLVTKNFHSFRTRLEPEGTLNALLYCKMNALSEIKCYEFEPTIGMLKKAKKAGLK